MSEYEKQFSNAELALDDAILLAQDIDLEQLTSIVPGSRLHEVITATTDDDD